MNNNTKQVKKINNMKPTTNIHKNEPIRQGFIHPKVRFLTVSALLLGIQSGCSSENVDEPNPGVLTCGHETQSDQKSQSDPKPQDDQKSQADSKAKDGQKDKADSKAKDGKNAQPSPTSFRTEVMCLENNSNVSFIKVDQPSKAKARSSEVGLLFYAPKGLTNWSKMHLSKEGITLFDNKGKSEQIRDVIVVEGEVLKSVCRKARSLEDKNQGMVHITYDANVVVPHELDDSLMAIVKFKKEESVGKKVVFRSSEDGFRHRTNIASEQFFLVKDSFGVVSLMCNILCGSFKEDSEDYKTYSLFCPENGLAFKFPDFDIDKINSSTLYYYAKEGNYQYFICMNKVAIK